MKQFDIPEFYRSPIIAKVKAKRKLEDPRKQDFSPTVLALNKIEFILPRHFGFCYGVENAIEKSYLALKENPNKRIYLLSQMIHNPAVNEDLQANGINFLQDTHGKELISFDTLTPEDVVIIPAFGTTLEIETALQQTGANITSYNTTCPFVEKVWNRSQKLGELAHTVIIHGKYDHEETRATFSHSNVNAPTLVIKNMDEAVFLGEVIAQRKMLALKNEIAKDELLICADTLVFLDNRVLSKPRDREEARSMLESLSGRDNTVITGVCLYHHDQTITFSERTIITFETLTPENIDQYLDTEVCYDRAGAYGIQDWIGLIGVREIRGSYTNVMGLPTHRLYQEIRKF